MTRSQSRAAAVLLAVGAIGLIAASQSWLLRRNWPPEEPRQLLYLPNGRFLQVASLGQTTFMADLVYLWSIQYYGTYQNEQRFAFLEHVYSKVISRLDPRYVDPYLVGALIMVVEKKDVEAALRLLDQGMKSNPDQWILPYEAGFWAYDTAHDYARAADYFRRAMAIPGAPPSVRRMHAELFNKKGDKSTSLALWKDILETAEDENVRAIAAKHVHDLTLEVDLQHLREAVAAYRRARGRYPPRLSSLVAMGLLKALPVDPEGNAYRYAAQTGEVQAASRFRLRRH
ncbi:MAG: tetratricopeptide repeat protein [Acidobacteriota bacterium]